LNLAVDINIAPGSTSWLRLARLAKLLSSLTLVWLGIEGTIGLVAGILAGSIALVAFGLDSAIEGLASVIIIWRFTGSPTISADAERRALDGRDSTYHNLISKGHIGGERRYRLFGMPRRGIRSSLASANSSASSRFGALVSHQSRSAYGQTACDRILDSQAMADCPAPGRC